MRKESHNSYHIVRSRRNAPLGAAEYSWLHASRRRDDHTSFQKRLRSSPRYAHIAGHSFSSHYLTLVFTSHPFCMH